MSSVKAKCLTITNFFPVQKSGEDIFFSNEYIYGHEIMEVIPYLCVDSLLYLKKNSITKLLKLCLSYFFDFLLLLKYCRLLNLLNDLKSIFRTLQALDIILKKKSNFEVYYTFWCNDYTLALCLFKHKYNKNCRIITRVHGVDYIAERHPYDFFARSFLINTIDNIVPQCKWAINYFTRYRISNLNKVIPIPIGVTQTNYETKIDKSNCIYLASCSNLIKLKRIDLAIDGIKELALNCKDKNFEYHVIGSGPELINLKKISNNSPKNLKVIFTGQIDNAQLINYYKNNNINFFIHLSRTEGGIPLAIQEALSFGLIIVSAKVNCINDLVGMSNGLYLLPKTFDITEFYSMILNVINTNSELLVQYSEQNIKVSNKFFNKEKNSKKLINLINENINYNN